MFKSNYMKIIVFVFFVLIGKLSFAQNSNFDDLSKVQLSCKECKEIVNTFHSAFTKYIQINSIEFYPMKALVENCYKNKKNDCGGDTNKQLELLAGRATGGPSSSGDDSRWRIGRNANENYSKIKISKEEAINNFKKIYNESLVKDCAECLETVERFYTYFRNNSFVNQPEFDLLKKKTQKCINQKFGECGVKFDQLSDILRGRATGGPSSSGDDSKWRITYDNIWNWDSEYKNINTRLSGDIIFTYKNNYGVKDKDGLIFIYPNFNKIEEFKFNNTDYYLVSQDGKKGIIDAMGNIKIPVEYRKIESASQVSNKLIYTTFDNKNGLIFNDFNSKEINCDRLFFYESFCIAQTNNQYGFVDGFGNIKIQPKYDKVHFIGENFNFKYHTKSDIVYASGGGSIETYYIPSNDVLVVQKNNKLGLVGGPNLEELLPPNFDLIGHKNVSTSQCIKGLIPVWENGKMGYVNEKGILVITPKYQQILGFGMKGLGEGEVSFVKKDNKWGLFSNKNLKELTPLEYDEISISQNGYGLVRVGNKYGLVSIDGKEIFKPQFDKIIELNINNDALVVQNGGLYGLVKTDGTILTPTSYQSIEINYGYWNTFQKAAWNIKRENKIGIINDKGILIVQPKYQEIKEFDGRYGLASIKFNGKYGMINGDGIEIIKPIYDYPLNFNDGKSNASINGKSLTIKTDGSIFTNNFPNSSLSSLDLNRESISVALDKKFEKMYTDATSKIIYSNALGIKFNYQSFINNSTNEIMEEVESWLGGKLTNSQLNEFYSIRTMSEKRVTSYLAQLSGFLKANPQFKNNSAYGEINSSSSRRSAQETNSTSNSSKTCIKCSKGFTISDYDEYSKRYSNFRKETRYGFIPCHSCQGTKKMSVTAGSDYRGKGCTICNNSGWLKCNVSVH